MLEQILTTYSNLFELEHPTGVDVDSEPKPQWRFCGFTATVGGNGDNERDNTKSEEWKEEFLSLHANNQTWKPNFITFILVSTNYSQKRHRF